MNSEAPNVLTFWQQARDIGVTHVPLALNTPNLGDDIQSEAARRWFAVHSIVPRDRPQKWPVGACVALCGWWTINFLPPPGVRVVLIGMHLDPRCHRRLTADHWQEVKKLVDQQGFPMGCRDLETLQTVRRSRIDAVFSGCVTQTLPAANANERQGRYAVDCTPPDGTWTHLTHQIGALGTMNPKQRLALACERLALYASAEAVLTSRLHAFLPARALGVPSVQWQFDKAPINPSRLSGHYLEFPKHGRVPAPQPVIEPMTTQKHPLQWNAILWERDQEQVLTALNGNSATGSRLRAHHSTGLLELRDSVTPCNLAETLRGHGVDLGLPLDLEFLPNEANQNPENAQPHSSMPLHPAASPSGDTLPTAVEPTSPPLPTRLAPMFFRADGGVLDLADLYRGQTLFLVLNGTSLKDFDFDRLKQPGICSMGINNGAHGFRPQFWTCVDDPTRFLDSIWRDPAIQKFVPQDHLHKPIWNSDADTLSAWKVRDFPNVLSYRRNERFQANQWLHEDTFNWGNHQQYGGGRSVMLIALRLAYLLGFRKVHLLGCDFHMDEQNRYWFHEQRTASAIRNNTNSYRTLTSYFEQLKPHFDHAGFQVFNTNPYSHLKVFPFVDLDSALSQARVPSARSTFGMYVDRLKPTPPPKEEGREFLEPLLAAVNDADVQPDPFIHLQLTNLFPDSTYRTLLAHLPDDRHYQELRHAEAIQPDGKSARLRFAFADKEMASLPPEQRTFWHRVLVALRDPSLEKAFRQKLKAGLHERFRDSLSEIVLRPVPELIRDLPGYRISPHTGIFKKVITIQMNLPEDSSQEALSTTFYRQQGKAQSDSIHKSPFLPATGHAFAINAQSWHGVETLPHLPKPRNSLTLTYYLTKTPNSPK